MVDLNKEQSEFLAKFLNGGSEGTSADDVKGDAARLKSLARRTKATLTLVPKAERILTGLLTAAEVAFEAGDFKESERQANMLEERLDTLEDTETLPKLEEVVQQGLLANSQALLPEDEAALAASYEAALAELEGLPDNIRDACVAFSAELNTLKARGEQLVALLEKGDLSTKDRAAHHSEVDQIYARVETLNDGFASLLKKEGVL